MRPRRRYGILQLWLQTGDGDWESISCPSDEGMARNWTFERSIYGVGFRSGSS